MDSTFSLFLIVAFAVIAIAIYAASTSREKRLITEYLTKRGATNIQIDSVYESDRDTNTYQVGYTNASGKKCRQKCKMRTGIYADDKIYWLDVEENSDDNKTSPEEIKSAAAPSIDQDNQLSKQLQDRSNNALPSYAIIKKLAIQDSSDWIVLLAYDKVFANALRCQNDGVLLWQAELPTGVLDAYIEIAWQAGQLTAISKSAMQVVLDVDTGKILQKTAREHYTKPQHLSVLRFCIFFSSGL